MVRSVLVVMLAGTLAACAAYGSDLQIASASKAGATGVEPPQQEISGVDAEAVAVGRELRELDESIETARDRGQLTKKEARRYRRQADTIGREADRLGADGMTSMEAQSLEVSARGVESLLNAPAPSGFGDTPD